MSTRTYSLFGSAITIANLASDLLDTSLIRQVPDTQEVFLSKSVPNLSLIVEVCQSVAPHDPIDAIKFHLDSLAQDNQALSSTHVTLPHLPLPADFATATTFSSIPSLISLPITISSHQLVSKFNKPDSEAEEVLIMMALWRIASKDVDLVLCVNYPLPSLRGAAAIGEGERSQNGAGVEMERVEQEGERKARELFAAAVQNLEVVDFGLFAS